MNFRLAGLCPNSITDGPGLRLTVFFQGCIRHCEGCQNPQTWPINGGDKADTGELLKALAADPMLKGLSLSGGEPFLQAGAALELARGAHRLGKDVWCWSGYCFEEMLLWEDVRAELLKELDVLVDGPFILAQRSLELPWRGSKNQRVLDVKASLKKGEAVLLPGQN